MSAVATHISVEPGSEAFPLLTPAQIERLRPHGKLRHVEAGEVLFEPGDSNVPVYVVLSGGLEILQPCPKGVRSLVRHAPGSITGEFAVISGQRALLRGQVIASGEFLQIASGEFRVLVAKDAELGDILMKAYILRRMLLISEEASNVLVLGSLNCANTLRLREFLGRNGYPYKFIDLDTDERSQSILDHFHNLNKERHLPTELTARVWHQPDRLKPIYTGSCMQIPWYISWPIVIAFVIAILFMAARRAPYYPLKYPSGFWELQSKLGAEDVWLLTSDGVRLHAWWVMAPQASLVTLYLHGNAGNITHRFMQIRENTAAGSSVLMLDYRGFGKSEGSPSEHGLYADADAAYLYLLDHGYSARHILQQGESLGTAAAVDLASRKECAGVVLVAAFTAGRDVANTVLPVIGPLLFRGFDTKSKIANIRAPLLFLHGDRDEIIPLKLGRSLFEVAPEPKWFIEIPGAGHNDLVETAGSSYRERLHEFYGQILQ